MDKVIWIPEYSIGKDAIDTQHQKMFAIINQLTEEPPTEDFQGYISNILHEMTEYYKEHFADEEMLLAEINYPELDQHKQIHRTYIKQTAKFCMDSLRHRDHVCQRIYEYLSDWLVNHILKTDFKYKPYL